MIKYLKSKNNKAAKFALGIAIVIIIIFVLIMFSGPQNAEKQNDLKRTALIVAAIIAFVYWQRRKDDIHQDAFDILKSVADDVYAKTGLTLDTGSDNVTISRGGIDETYIEFKAEGMTYLHLTGVGVVEAYNAKDISQIKTAKQKDEIAMSLAKAGIALRKGSAIMDMAGIVPEEEDN